MMGFPDRQQSAATSSVTFSQLVTQVGISKLLQDEEHTITDRERYARQWILNLATRRTLLPYIIRYSTNSKAMPQVSAHAPCRSHSTPMFTCHHSLPVPMSSIKVQSR